MRKKLLLVLLPLAFAFAEDQETVSAHAVTEDRLDYQPFVPPQAKLPVGGVQALVKTNPKSLRITNLYSTVLGLQTAAQVAKNPNYLDINAFRKAAPNEFRKPNDPISASQYSFCSSAVDLHVLLTVEALQKRKDNSYAVLRNKDLNKALTTIGDPKTVIGGKLDGMGIFGHINANGPGLAVLFKKLNLGPNFVYTKNLPLKKGDYLKIFWKEKEDPDGSVHPLIGKSESGHLVVVEKREVINGQPGIWIWSSNPLNEDGTSGYGRRFIPDSDIKFGIVSRLENPQNFIKWNTLPEDQKNDKWLYSLNDDNEGSRDVNLNDPKDLADFAARTGIDPLEFKK